MPEQRSQVQRKGNTGTGADVKFITTESKLHRQPVTGLRTRDV